LIEDDPKTASYGLLLTDTQLRLAESLVAQKRPMEADEFYREAISSLEKLAATFPADASHRVRMAATYNRLAAAIRKERPDDAEKAHREAVAIYEQLVEDIPGVKVAGEGLGHSYRLLARSLDPTKKGSEREQLWRQAAIYFEKLLSLDGASNRTPHRRFLLADTYRSLADDLSAQQRSDEALTIYRQAQGNFALVTAEALTGALPDLVWRRNVLSLMYKNYTDLLKAAGRHQEAEHAREKAIELFRKLAAERSEELYFRKELAKHQAELANLKEKP